MRLNGKTALIAGAGRDSGRAIALTFAREGADLILIAQKRGDALNQIARECESLGVKALPLLGDISREDEVNRMTKSGLERFGKVDILVSVAAIRPAKLPWEYTGEEWLQTFAVNLHATFYLAKALVPGMIERKTGSIVALGGSSMVTVSSGNTAAVIASKSGLHGLIKSLAQALAPHGIRANSVGLANIANKDRDNPEFYKDRATIMVDPARAAMVPMKRKASHQEVANVVLFLASDESSYVTGDRILCTGGMQV
jgi:3-oxoacyl-[acyl-carrier protein] reductase